MMAITIHQAIFGEKNRGHSLISSTIDDNLLIHDLQDYHTDRPPNYPSNGWQSIVRGFVLHGYYVILKIVPDQEASRPGMVFTHALIIDLKEIISYSSFFNLYNKLPLQLTHNSSLTTIIINEDASFPEIVVPKGYSKLVNVIAREQTIKYPIVWLGEESFFAAIHHLWKNVWPQGRQQITFSTSYSPRDIPAGTLIVSTPTSQIDAWQGYLLVKEDEYIDATTPAELILLGDNTDTTMWEIQKDLECEDLDLRNIRLLQLCQSYWFAIDSTTEISGLIQLARVVAKLAPERHKGSGTKQKIISQLCTRASSASVEKILALRNLDTQAFDSECLYKSIFDWFGVNFVHEREQKFSEFISIVVGQSPQNAVFWSRAVTDGIRHILSPKWTLDTGRMIWRVWRKDISFVDKLESVIENDVSIDKVLRETCPNHLSTELGNSVAGLASSRNWLVTHARVITRFLSPVDALKRQMEHDKEQDYSDGLKELFRQFRDLYSDSIAVEVFANYTNDRTDKILAELYTERPELILHFDPSTDLGGRIWGAALKNSSQLLESVFMPNHIVFTLFDVWLDTSQVDTKLLKHFANSPYGNLLHYPRRDEMWERLDNDIKRLFLEKTARAWIEAFWQQNLEDFALEAPLQKAVLESQKIIRSKLESIDIQTGRFALDFFRNFSNDLSERKFIDWFLKKQFYRNIPIEIAQDIGDYVFQRRWSDAATEIARHVEKYSNSRWRYVLDRCQSLVKNKNLLESLADILNWENRHYTPVQMTISLPKIRVLFLMSDPVDETRIKLSGEIKSIEYKLRLSGIRDRFETKVEQAATPGDLQGAILSFRPHIVHFSGHGSKSGELMFEDGSGKAKPIPVNALSDLFQILQGSIKCVVLNACFSEKQAVGITKSIDCVIGMSHKIHDNPAATFASHFYQALAHEDDIKKAFDLGCNAINLASLPDDHVAKLLIREGATNLKIFD